MEQLTESQKTLGVSSYVPFVGWIVAYVAARLANDHAQYTIFHLRQGLGFSITVLLCILLFDNTLQLWWLSQLIHVALVVGGLIGIYGALRGRRLAQPLLGRLWHTVFAFIR